MPRTTLNAFTVDVEDYFHVSAFEALFPRERWSEVPSRIDGGLRAILDIASQAGVKGTFFVLGWVAQRRPDLVRMIANEGHELGCHSLWHRLVYGMTRDAFRADLRQALSAIRDASGVDCLLYRAPSFSVTGASLWALDVLAEEGIRIDSSVYPVRHDRYGMPNAPLGPFRPLRHHPQLVEFPPSAVRLLGASVPCAGGGYLRIFPFALTTAAIRRINGHESRPAVVYVHPWELDPDQPKVPAGLVSNWRHRMNLRETSWRLRALLSGFTFAPLSVVTASLGGASALPFHDLGASASAR